MVTTGIFVVVALSWGWLSDGCRGIRWPFIYAGAIITVSPLNIDFGYRVYGQAY